MLDRVQGSLDMMILKTLMNGTMHGWGIAHHIRGRSNEALQVNAGRTLSRAPPPRGRQTSFAATWGISDNNRRARFYTISAAGKSTSPPKQPTGSPSCRRRPVMDLG